MFIQDGGSLWVTVPPFPPLSVLMLPVGSTPVPGMEHVTSTVVNQQSCPAASGGTEVLSCPGA